MKEPKFENPTLTYFKVEGLHGRQDVGLLISGRNGVFIADNGSGKTTALYILQCVLKGDFAKLVKFKFDRIVVEFSGVEPFVITADDFAQSKAFGKMRFVDIIMDRTKLTAPEVFRLARNVSNKSIEILRRDKQFMDALRLMGVPISMFVARLRAISAFSEGDLVTLLENSPIASLSKFLKTYFRHSVLYFPTYRRVEQDISELFKADFQDKDELGANFKADIHFGMKDVVGRQNDATRQIRDRFIESYGQISGQMLGQLAENTPVSEEMRTRLIDRSKIELVLGRVGENVSPVQKKIILEMHDNGILLDNVHLSFFLSSLIEAYHQVRKLDAALQRYAQICNGYLINKEMRYDSLNANVAVYETVGGTKLDLNTLSSGEKQILGVMSELYLGKHESYVVVFDEPELSLSIEWQRKILVDVASSERTHMLIAVTHSPFVFENELDSFARSLEVSFHSPATE